mgnify:CR=1 FL=1
MALVDKKVWKEMLASGKELGLEGERLAEYIDRQTKLKLDQEAKEKEALLEEKKIAADLEQRRLAAEAAERQEIRKHEYELERLRLEARPAVGVATGLDDNVRRPQDPRLAQLSIPIFNDKAENIDDYLLCFEKLAKAHRIPDIHWAVNV